LPIRFRLGLCSMTRKRQLFPSSAPLTSPGLQPFRTYLVGARHLPYAFPRVQLAHRCDFQFAGILLSGHKHCSPPFNVIGPLISCLTFGVHSSSYSSLPCSSPFAAAFKLGPLC